MRFERNPEKRLEARVLTHVRTLEVTEARRTTYIEGSPVSSSPVVSAVGRVCRGSQAGIRDGSGRRLVRMNTSRRRGEGGTSGLRDLHDWHAMYTRGIRIGCTFLRVSVIDVGGRGSLDLMCLCFVRTRRHLGCLNHGQVLGILLHFLNGIALGV